AGARLPGHRASLSEDLLPGVPRRGEAEGRPRPERLPECGRGHEGSGPLVDGAGAAGGGDEAAEGEAATPRRGPPPSRRLVPRGLAFAPRAVIADTDRAKLCIRRVIDLYRRQQTDYADCLQAAWRFGHRAALRHPDGTLADVAAADGVRAQYLASV